MKKSYFLFVALMGYINSSHAIPLSEYCEQQAIGITAEMRASDDIEINNEDVEIARLAAKYACIKTYRDLKGQPVSAKRNDDEGTENKETVVAKEEEEKKGQSIFERLLEGRKGEDVNPMLKKHRTGGK